MNPNPRKESAAPDLSGKLRSLPKSPGVYLLKDASGGVIYIGKARVLRHRVRQYFQSGNDGRYQYSMLVNRIADIEVIPTDSELEALILENTLIRERKPRYNIDLRDDKSFPFLRVTNEPYPRVFLTRRPELDGSKYFGPYSDLFHLKGLIRVLRSMLKIRTCNLALTEAAVDKGKFKVCLEYHIGHCNAPCTGNESRAEYAQRVRDFLDVVAGRGSAVVQRLRIELEQLGEGMKFEQAAQLRDWLSALDQLTQRQKVITAEPVNRDVFGIAVEDDRGCAVIFQIRGGRMIGRLQYRLKQVRGRETGEILEEALQRYYSEPVTMPEQVFLPFELPQAELIRAWLRERAGGKIEMRVPARGDKAALVELAQRNAELVLGEYELARQARDRIPAALLELQQQLQLAKLPRTIAAFDISTLLGADKVASMVVFKNGRPARSEYRRFKIRTVTGMDDFACMKEAVARRFSRLARESLPYPDLLLIDGGKGQVAAAREALRELRLADQPLVGLAKRLEEIYLPGESDPRNLPRTSSALKLLQQVRDEAHRFAIAYHRQLRKQRSLESQLDRIAGIGPARRKLLLVHFGSVAALKQASLADIERVPGLPTAVAARIADHFRTSTDE